MTQDEKLIWTAVFAATMSMPHEQMTRGDRIVRATQEADHTLDALRRAKKHKRISPDFEVSEPEDL